MPRMRFHAIKRHPDRLIEYDDRLIVAVDFEKAIVWIKWIGTHKDYDKINVSEVDHEH